MLGSGATIGWIGPEIAHDLVDANFRGRTIAERDCSRGCACYFSGDSQQGLTSLLEVFTESCCLSSHFFFGAEGHATVGGLEVVGVELFEHDRKCWMK